MSRMHTQSIGLNCLMLAALTAPAIAQEVTVQNDTFSSGGPLVVVGDFVAGEQAGVRLAAPCAGDIVAVQIGWVSQFGGTGQTLHGAIHIYDGNTFPTPGTALETIVGPVLSDGAINEYRFLDEAQAIPLRVPVSAGQKFYVALEFAEATNVGGGGPSIFRDTDGCTAGSNVLHAIPGGWLNFCLFLGGDVVMRAVIEPSCPGDVDGNGVVNLSDLSIVLANFGASVAPGMDGDLNGDGVVDLSDLGELLANFGVVC